MGNGNAKNFTAFAETNVKEFKEALNRVSVTVDYKNRRVEFIFYPNKVVLKTESPETGNSIEEVNRAFQRLGNEITAQTDSGGAADDWKIAFNTKYLMDCF